MPEAEQAPKKVPKRADIAEPGVLQRNQGTGSLDGADPDYHYQSFSQDPKHPGYWGNFARRHFYGEGQPFGRWMPAWEKVNAQTDPNVRAVEPSTSQGSAMDTQLRGPGDQIVMRMHKNAHAAYGETDRANNKEREEEMFRPDVTRGAQQSITTVLAPGINRHFAEVLAEAGHSMPGMNVPR